MDSSILGMGNALTDILTILPDDTLLESFSLLKGGMQHVDLATAEKMWHALQPYGVEYVPGGSSSNTVAVTSALGMKSGYIGKVGNDMIGDIFERGLKDAGVDCRILRGEAPSGRATVFITPPGAERTFATYLGAAMELNGDELRGEYFEGYKYFHLEGYLMQNYTLVRRAVEIAREKGMTISVDMASYNVVARNLPFLKEIVEQYADIVFANEHEAKIFTGKPPREALDELAGISPIAVVKLGPEGSLVKSGDEFHSISSYPAKEVDATGAGDVYQAAFLYAHSRGATLCKCAQAGSLAAAKVVEVIGPKISKNILKTTKAELETLLGEKD